MCGTFVVVLEQMGSLMTLVVDRRLHPRRERWPRK